MELEHFIKRADELLALAGAVLATRTGPTEWGNLYVDRARFAEFRTASLSFLRNLYASDHPYFKDFETRVLEADPSDTEKGKGILSAVRGELVGGWLRTTRGIVAAELFADFLEMAQHLLAEGYKDAAAVMVGSVLEAHLRELCILHQIPVQQARQGGVAPRKADALNADLAKASAYRALDQKNITAWLDLRNRAAHGHYGEYTADQVANMLSGVMEFMARVAP